MIADRQITHGVPQRLILSGHDHDLFLRYDGQRAEIRRMHEGEGDITLGETTDVAVDVTVKANIPLVGGKVASAAEPYVGKALSLQSREADAWIASH